MPGGMPLGASTEPLSKAESAQLEAKVNSWKTIKIGREVVKKVGKNTVEGTVFSVEQDELRGPPATLISTFTILWDKAGLNHKKQRPLANLLPGDTGVEQEIVSGQELDDGHTITMRSGFSHPELMLPIKILQEHQWRWKNMAPQQQRLLLEWTPMDELAARQKRHKALGDEVIAKMEAERQAQQAPTGRGPRRDAPSGKNRPASVVSPAQKRAKQRWHDPPTSEDADGEASADKAMPDTVSGDSDGFADAREDALPAEEDDMADFLPTGRPPPVLTPRRQSHAQDVAPHVPDPAAGAGKPSGRGNAGGGAAADGAAAATKAAGGAPKSKKGGASGRAKKASGGAAAAAAQVALPASSDEAGPAALDDMVWLPPGSNPPAVPIRLTLNAGDKLVQEYKDQLFAAEEEFEPQHIVAQRPADQPREYLVKWRNYELDPRDWSAYVDLKENKVLDAWERAHPPPQGAGKPPPPLLQPKSAAKGSAKRKRKR